MKSCKLEEVAMAHHNIPEVLLCAPVPSKMELATRG